MKPIDIDKLFKRKAFNNDSDSTLKNNGTTGEKVVSEDTTEETSIDLDNLGEESMVNIEDVPNQPYKVNDKIE